MDNSHENRIFRLENAVIDLRARLEETATKNDLQIAVTELRDKIDSLQVDAKLADARTDLADARTDLNGKIETSRTDLNSKIEAFHTELNSKIDGLRAEMYRGFANMIKWIVGTAIALGATGLTVITFVLNNATPKAPAAAPAPIIIYAQPAPTAKP